MKSSNFIFFLYAAGMCVAVCASPVQPRSALLKNDTVAHDIFTKPDSHINSVDLPLHADDSDIPLLHYNPNLHLHAVEHGSLAIEVMLESPQIDTQSLMEGDREFVCKGISCVDPGPRVVHMRCTRRLSKFGQFCARKEY